MFKIDSHGTRTGTDLAGRTWINGVCYTDEPVTPPKSLPGMPDGEAPQTWTVTEDVTPPEGWDAVLYAFKCQDVNELARLAVANL